MAAGPATAQDSAPTTLLPSILGQAPAREARDQAAGGTLAPGPQSLGTIPAGALQGVAGGALDIVLAGFDGPLPAPGLQAAAREALVDRAVAEATTQIKRAEALYALGFVEDAAGAAVEQASNTVEERAATARMLLALDRVPQACQRVDLAELPQGAAPGPTFELLEILAMCKAIAGNGEAGKLIVEVLRDQGGSDKLYFALFDAAFGGRPGVPAEPTVREVRPVHAALLRRSGVPPPASYVERAGPALAVTLARDETLTHDARIAAAERAVSFGLLPAGELVRLYGATPIDLDLLGQAATGRAPPGPLARAHLFALIAEARGEVDRMRFITEMYAQGAAAGVGLAVAEAVGEDLAGIDPGPSVTVHAARAVEILARGDRAQAALAWIDAGEFPTGAAPPALSGFAAHQARAIVAVTAPDAGVGGAAGALGRDAGGGRLSAVDRAFVKTEVAVMTALGDAVSPVLMEIAGSAPPPFGGAAAPGQVLAALAPLAGESFAKADDAAIAEAVAALAAYGLRTEARRAAAEALIARAGR
jgi:hypothetical protein